MKPGPASPPSGRLTPDRDLLDLLARELERPRPLPAQVLKHLSGTHDVERDKIGEFLLHSLPGLEDYEIDLALAPVFTPTLAEQIVFAEFLGAGSVATNLWADLVGDLVRRPTIAHLATEDGQSYAVPLREVSIERFVHRLRLNGTIAPDVFDLVENRVPAGTRPLLKAIARRAIWELPSRRAILERFIQHQATASRDWANDAVHLLRLMESYEPADAADLLGRIPHWEHVLRHEVSAAGSPKPFFNERVQELHGGGRDQRGRAGTSPQEQELEFLASLKTCLGA